MNFSTGALAVSASLNFDEMLKILSYIKRHPSEEGTLAKKAFVRMVIITLLIIFLVTIPLCIYTITTLANTYAHPDYPDNAVKEVRGHIALYEDTFWYTDSSQKYEFNLKEYTSDDSFEPGEIIEIYLDEEDQVVSIAHRNQHYELTVKLALMYLIPITLLLAHAIVGRKTYCKWWNLYVQWYLKEIQLYEYRYDFEAVTYGKQYYNVSAGIHQLGQKERRQYRRIVATEVILGGLFLACIVLTIYVCNRYSLNVHSLVVMAVIAAYVLVFYILFRRCDKKILRLRTEAGQNKTYERI